MIAVTIGLLLLAALIIIAIGRWEDKHPEERPGYLSDRPRVGIDKKRRRR